MSTFDAFRDAALAAAVEDAFTDQAAATLLAGLAANSLGGLDRRMQAWALASPGYRCPRCQATSTNPNDAREGYCGRCHDWTREAEVADCVCDQTIRAFYAQHGIEVNTSPWRADLVPTGYEELNMTCPHGVRWHAEPTAEQMLRWRQRGER